MKKRHPHKHNVLLVNITRLGDMLQATPTIAGMKMENPDCRITVVVEKQFDQVLRNIPNIDEIVSIDLGMTVRSLAREGEGVLDAYDYVSEFVARLKAMNFDYCLNMSSSAYSAMLINALEIKRIGGWTSDDEGYRIIDSDWARLFATSVFHQNRQFNSLNLVDVWRASADVEQHPQSLLLDVGAAELEFARDMIASAGFTNTGPIVAVQAGASQGKRQWAPYRFVNFIKELTEKHNVRVLMTGTSKELGIIDQIKNGCASQNVFVAAGKTNVPQLAALLKLSDLLVTGDTGPMHISVAVGTPVVAMFLASAFGYETGPYSAGNIVLQPVIGCGPCNPNKPCSRPDCHDHIDPQALAQITLMRLGGDIRSLPAGLVDQSKVIVYRTFFDSYGFYDMQALTDEYVDSFKGYRDAYRKLWLDDLGGYEQPSGGSSRVKALQQYSAEQQALGGLREYADLGGRLINELIGLVNDSRAPARKLGEVNDKLTELDRQIEQMGFHFPALGPITRMFVFAKENIQGSDAVELASQMSGVYADLGRRAQKLDFYFRMN